VSLLAALLGATAVWFLAETLQGRRHHLVRPAKAHPARSKAQIWLSQAGAAVTSGQFAAVSVGVGLVFAIIMLAISRTAIVAFIGLVVGACTPYAYWSARRRQLTSARALAWPDALRHVIGALGSGTATLHSSLVDLADAGPLPLRPPMARYARRSAQIGSLGALEAVRAELADPVSDQVLLTFAQAVSEGTDTVLRTLEVLLEQTSADIALQDRVRTAGTQLRLASWVGFVAPLFVLVLFCTVSAQYRAFFDGTEGVIVVVIGTAIDTVGLAVTRRLARTVPTTQRIFTEPQMAR
jgi:Flp pilus assembly protein TadB